MRITRKALIVIIASVIIVVAVVGAVVGVTFAIWQENEHASLYVETDIQDDNPSIKYSMYVPLTDSGQSATQETSRYKILDGVYNISNGVYSYTLNNGSDISKISAFGFCGWYGGIALDSIDIPDQLTMTINGTTVTKPVTRVMSAPDFEDYTLIGNQIIRKVVIGKNVEEIDSGIFFAMQELAVCEFKQGDTEILIRDYAFANCFKLKSYNYTNKRTLSDDTNVNLIFLDCGVE